MAKDIKNSLLLQTNNQSVATLIPEYQSLLKTLQQEITTHLNSIKEFVDYQTIVINWNTGRQVVEHLRKHNLGENPSEVLTESLGKDLNTSKRVIQYCVSFYKQYSLLPKREKNLTWTHYTMLFSFADPKERELWQNKIIRENINTSAFRELMRSLKTDVSDHEVEVLNQKLTVTKGEVYLYRIIQMSFINALSPTVCLDCGFNICLDYLLSDTKRYDSGQLVRSIKKDSNYQLELTKVGKENLYTYKAAVERVVDADTLLVKIDVGFGISLRQRLRLRGVNSPEIKTVKGDEAKAYVEVVLSQVNFIVVKTYRVEKYGRYLADVFYLPKTDDVHKVSQDGIFLNQELLNKGFAEAFDGSQGV